MANSQRETKHLEQPVKGGQWRKKDSAPSLADQAEPQSTETRAPYPDTAIADDAAKFRTVKEHSEKLNPAQKNHTGKGPRGWSRSDQMIQEDVCERLKANPRVDATDIEVRVHDGMVTLTGEVVNRQTKREAELCLDHIPGIRDVENQLRFNKP
jgi:osmotically-inducible protein OsmY